MKTSRNWKLSGGYSRSCFFRVRVLRHGEAEANLAAFGGSACFALVALLRSFVGAQAAHFLKDAFHLKLGLETFQGAVNRFAFADLDFSHGCRVGDGKGRGG